ncbi:bifunctional acetate--CoA ligase family protein/GNAT family N-acetyltransferase [Gynuella sunshinyii]|uniref:Acyl-CoA synthetase (NDP forming) n=1 Tax=Gynuella sunshinyii YC6258 TaxID=1445510 RepID=A0A0C5VIT7_9GAMM|nr:GNAT family N-acetyltransferase [Gynuella sunshinyii]AJQ94592.1 acyl-CoA synthetase (NDP forming) [Gynuella sunshinyii YC6258]
MSALATFFNPDSIVVFGASEREGSMGALVMKNIVAAGYDKTLIAINLKPYTQVFGVPCYQSLAKIKQPIDLAIICLPAENIAKVLKQIAKKKIRSAVLLTGGISRQKGATRAANQGIRDLAIKLGIRIIGPNSMGVMIPALKINASFAHLFPSVGTTAFVGQSAAMGSALLDWAVGRGIGFSHFITVGAAADVEIADIVDYLAADRRVKSILLNIETLPDARRLMTALRAASRTKKVLAIRSGLKDPVPAGLKSRDRVDYRFFRRAGVLEAESMDGLFNGFEILNRMKPLFFESLAIISNGLGTSMLALNRLVQLNGQLADMSSIKDALKDITWYQDEIGFNPMVVAPNTSTEGYRSLLQMVDKVKGLGAIMLVVTPNHRSHPMRLAESLVPLIKSSRHMVLTCWLGIESVREARELFDRHNLLNFDSPSEAVEAFMIMVHHERNQTSLRETPPQSFSIQASNKATVASLILSVKQKNRKYLTWVEARTVLEIYGFNLVGSNFYTSQQQLFAEPDQAYPVSLRLVHEAYCYPFAYDDNPRTRWRGVVISINDFNELKGATQQLLSDQKKLFPGSKVLGFGVQPMRRKMDSLVFSMGLTRDSLVGPLVVFGEGGSTADILADRRFGLPPLNSNHTRKLIYRSHAYSVLSERSDNPEKDIEELSTALMAVSQIAIDHPEIEGLEANLLLLPDHSLLVLGVAINLGKSFPSPIVPYPIHLEESLILKDGQELVLRPIRAEDEAELKLFFERMTAEALRFRFFGSRLNFEHRELAAMCQIDYDREMAFVAVDQYQRIWGEVRTWKDVNTNEIEFAVMVDPEMQGKGFGSQLMQRMIRYSENEKAIAIVAEIMSDNEPMLRLARHCGFEQVCQDDGVCMVKLELRKDAVSTG